MGSLAGRIKCLSFGVRRNQLRVRSVYWSHWHSRHLGHGQHISLGSELSLWLLGRRNLSLLDATQIQFLYDLLLVIILEDLILVEVLNELFHLSLVLSRAHTLTLVVLGLEVLVLQSVSLFLVLNIQYFFWLVVSHVNFLAVDNLIVHAVHGVCSLVGSCETDQSGLLLAIWFISREHFDGSDITVLPEKINKVFLSCFFGVKILDVEVTAGERIILRNFLFDHLRITFRCQLMGLDVQLVLLSMHRCLQLVIQFQSLVGLVLCLVAHEGT